MIKLYCDNIVISNSITKIVVVSVPSENKWKENIFKTVEGCHFGRDEGNRGDEGMIPCYALLSTWKWTANINHYERIMYLRFFSYSGSSWNALLLISNSYWCFDSRGLSLRQIFPLPLSIRNAVLDVQLQFEEDHWAIKTICQIHFLPQWQWPEINRSWSRASKSVLMPAQPQSMPRRIWMHFNCWLQTNHFGSCLHLFQALLEYGTFISHTWVSSNIIYLYLVQFVVRGPYYRSNVITYCVFQGVTR